MARKQKELRTDIGWSDASSITLFGKDFTNDILGHLNLGDMGFLELTGRSPNRANRGCSTRWWSRWLNTASRPVRLRLD